jgi:hypothetical protein
MARRTALSPGLDSLLTGATETIAASVPTALAKAVRAQTGKREFSRFVVQALHRELVRRNLDTLVNDLVAEVGPLDPAEMRAIDDVMRSG